MITRQAFKKCTTPFIAIKEDVMERQKKQRHKGGVYGHVA